MGDGAADKAKGNVKEAAGDRYDENQMAMLDSERKSTSAA